MSQEIFPKAKSIKNFIKSSRNRKEAVIFKNSEDLEKDFAEIVVKLKDPLSTTIFDSVANKDIKYFIEHNELDYKLFKIAIKMQKETILL